MNKSTKPTITIIGAGISGCFLAIQLAKRGYRVNVYERQSKKDIISNSSDRSYSISFYSFGVNVLKESGLWGSVKPYLVKLSGSVTRVHGSDLSQTIFAPNGEEITAYYTVQRSHLIEVFIRYAGRLKLIKFHFESALISIDRQNKKIILQNNKSNKLFRLSPQVLFGADGLNSIVRAFIQPGQESEHREIIHPWTYKQINISKDAVKRLKLRTDLVNTWSRKDAVMTAFPNIDGSFDAIMMLPPDKNHGFISLTQKALVKNFLTKIFPDLLPSLHDINDSILKNPESKLTAIYTYPWYYKDFMVILGDAAHGFLPFYGQGVSVGFADCLVLLNLIDKYTNRWSKIFELFEQSRKVNCDVIAQLSEESFNRYRRHKIADYSAVYDKFDSILHKLIPILWQPPLHASIFNDPVNSSKYFLKHNQQRKISRLFGLSLIVAFITGIIYFQKTMTKLFRKVMK